MVLLGRDAWSLFTGGNSAVLLHLPYKYIVLFDAVKQETGPGYNGRCMGKSKLSRFLVVIQCSILAKLFIKPSENEYLLMKIDVH